MKTVAGIALDVDRLEWQDSCKGRAGYIVCGNRGHSFMLNSLENLHVQAIQPQQLLKLYKLASMA